MIRLVSIFMAILASSHFAMTNAISVKENPKTWSIETRHSSYQTAVASDNNLIPIYFGPKGNLFNLKNQPLQVPPKVGAEFREIPYRGGFVNQNSILEVIFADNTRDTELLYDSQETKEIDGCPVLILHLKDKQYGLSVSQYMRVIPELDIYEKWLEIRNISQNPVKLQNALSGSIWLQADAYDLYHLSGRWGNECMLQKTNLTQGTKTLQTRDFRFFDNPTWFAVGPAGKVTETEGNVWFGGVEWEGNFRLDFEKYNTGQVQITGGINFWDTEWNLKPGETFTTPKMLFGFSNNGLEGASQRLHEYVRNHLIRKNFRRKLRPVLYNSWYATTFDIQEDQQLGLAEIAKDIGVELFVIDDGWFKGRKNDKAGLGDWTIDKEKFPDGLQPMIDKISAKGLDFGIWLEPEMVNPDSDLFRAHPDWAFYYPNRTRHERRNQYMLNLAREDVYRYLLDCYSHLLKNNNIQFIKWDYNRGLSDPGWPDADPATQKEVRIRYFYNFSRLVEELEKRFPNVWFECCAGGGGRLSYGLIPHFDQFWTSDNTDPADRLLIQDGFLRAFPPNMMVSWVTKEDWRKYNPSLQFRFLSSMCGVLGIGHDLTKWNEDQRKEAKQLIQQYKDIRPFVQNGIVHRLYSPMEVNKAAWEYRNQDGSQAAVFLFNLYETLQSSLPTSKETNFVRLRGLNPSDQYEISGTSRKASGADLMNIGLSWPLQGNFQSTLIKIKKAASNQ